MPIANHVAVVQFTYANEFGREPSLQRAMQE